MVDVVLVNDSPVTGESAAAYERAGAAPVSVDEDRLKAMGVKVTRAALARTGDVVRHDSVGLSDALLGILR